VVMVCTTVLMDVNMVRYSMMVRSMSVTTTVTMSMTVAVTHMSVFFVFDFFIDFLLLFGLASSLSFFIFVLFGADLLLDVARALDNFVVLVALDHADVVVVLVVTVFVLVSVVMV
jgi:hypothetical protein